MKRFTLILMAIIAMTMTAYGQWSLQTNPLGSSDAAILGKIQFVSATEGWIAAGHSGKLLHTTNAGTTWNIVNPFPSDTTGNMSDPGVSMSWPNATHGMVLKTYISGTGDITNIANGAVLYSTTDGGSSWTKKDFQKAISTVTYNTSDLQGTWQIHEIVVQNPTSSINKYNGWMHGTLTLNAAGSGSETNIVTTDGSQSDVNDVSLQISSFGEITVGTSSDLHGFMNADKNTIIMTSTEKQGSGYALYVLQKNVSATSYSLSDFQGTWQMHGLSVGNSTGAYAGWVYATLTGDASGNFIGSFTGAGGSGNINTTTSISSEGFITGMNSIGSNVHGFMSADKKTFYITMTGNETSDYNLVVFQKQATGTTYSLSDLQGFWQSHSLVSDNTNDIDLWTSWSHSRSTINSKGNVNISNLIVNGENRDDISTGMSITSNGIITFDGISNSHGFLSADKSFAIMTMPDMGSGGYTLGILQKDLTVSGDLGFQTQFVDNNTGWMSNYNAVYEKFIIYKTTDGGTIWNTTSNTVGGIYYFVDANNGWMIGNSVSVIGDGGLNNIYHTTNGGTSWVLQASNIGSANALHFTDLLNGWVVGRGGLALKTTDGGTTWTTITTTGQTSNSNSKAVFFSDASHGWIGSSYDTNNNENQTSSTAANSLILSKAKRSSKVKTDEVGTQFILATKDGGATWETQDTPVTNSIFSISFWDATNGWFTSDYGQIAHYTNTSTKTVYNTAGALSSALNTTEKNTLTDLTVTGTIDARDFKTLRDEMPMLANIDLSAATISAYTGSAGTYSTGYSYPANTLSRNALYKKATLKSIKLPANLISIGQSALYSCTALKKINIPASVTTIEANAFNGCGNMSKIYAEASTPVDLSASADVFLNANISNCILCVPVGSKAAYQMANQWQDFTNIVETGSLLTYNVTVPDGTKNCYIAGEMNNWTQQLMTKIDDTHYTITLQNGNVNQKYKYCSGPAWDYVEKAADGSEISNRSYSPYDVVASWRAVYNPPKVTASDYYLPLKIGNYTELYTTSTQTDGWSPRTTRYSFNRTDMINGVPYYLEEGWEGNFSNCNDCTDGPFRYMWIRKDATGNLLLGAFAVSDNNGNLTDDINKAYILPQPVLWFPNTFLNVGGYTTFAIEDTVIQLDSVISITATVGNYTNCIQVRDIQRTKSGMITFMEDSYYAYQVGLVKQNRLLPLNDIHTNYITNYLADTTTVIKNIKSGDDLFALYPNPASTGFYINTGSTTSTPLSIYDINGRMMLTKQVFDKELISISSFKKGIYIVKIQTESGSFAKKLVKE